MPSLEFRRKRLPAPISTKDRTVANCEERHETIFDSRTPANQSRDSTRGGGPEPLPSNRTRISRHPLPRRTQVSAQCPSCEPMTTKHFSSEPPTVHESGRYDSQLGHMRVVIIDMKKNMSLRTSSRGHPIGTRHTNGHRKTAKFFSAFDLNCQQGVIINFKCIVVTAQPWDKPLPPPTKTKVIVHSKCPLAPTVSAHRLFVWTFSQMGADMHVVAHQQHSFNQREFIAQILDSKFL